MTFHSLAPFVPSGADFEKAKQFFQELGFALTWDAGDYVGFESGACRFILQKFDNRSFAENFMITVRVANADKFWEETKAKGLVEKYGIRLGEPTDQPYGREVNITDAAGLCWHFVSE